MTLPPNPGDSRFIKVGSLFLDLFSFPESLKLTTNKQTANLVLGVCLGMRLAETILAQDLGQSLTKSKTPTLPPPFVVGSALLLGSEFFERGGAILAAAAPPQSLELNFVIKGVPWLTYA